MGFKSTKQRKKFFAGLNKAKPTSVELNITGAVLPFPKAEVNLKSYWELKKKKS